MNMEHEIYFSLAMMLLGMGVFLLVASLFPIRQLIIRLPRGKLRRRWFLLAGLTLLFLLGYIGFGIIFWNQLNRLVDLFVPGIFFFGACYVRLITSLSLHTTMDVRRVHLLEKENVTDPLTGIYNRRYLERRLEEEFFYAQQTDSSLSFLLIDIDHFKNINDSYGHPVGDQVISYLAKSILGNIRGCDILARFGGDEFVIIAFNTPPVEAAIFAEHIIKHVESDKVMIEGENNVNLEIKTTISIGVAGLTENVLDIRQLFQNADEALYCAKREGRNRVAIYPCLNKEKS